MSKLTDTTQNTVTRTRKLTSVVESAPIELYSAFDGTHLGAKITHKSDVLDSNVGVQWKNDPAAASIKCYPVSLPKHILSRP